MFVSTCCGVTAVATGHQLQRITPLIKAIETAEKNDFISQLATSQWIQEQQYQQQAVTALQPSSQQPVTIPVTDNRNSVTDAVSTVPEVTDKAVTQPVTDETQGVTDDAFQSYQPMYNSVMALKQQGVTDSDIIKDVLKQGGRNYEKGKAMLEALLQLGQSQGW